ncbi:MAG: HAMP domain-containing methyl-accepting chemotaxis protein [Acidobacteriota bacterium]
MFGWMPKLNLRWTLVIVMAIFLVVLGWVVSQTTTSSLSAKLHGQLEERGRSLANLLSRSVSHELAFGSDLDQADVDSVLEEDQVLLVLVRDRQDKQKGRATEESGPFAEMLPNELNPLLVKAQERRPDERHNGYIYRDDREGFFIVYKAVEWSAKANQGGGSSGSSSSAGAGLEMFEPDLDSSSSESASRDGDLLGHVFVALSTNAAVTDVEDARNTAWARTAVVAAIGILMSLGIALWVTSPLSKMVNAAEEMARGNYESATGLRMGRFYVREVGQLAEAFSGMRASLAEVADQARRIAAGDLSQRIHDGGNLGSAFNAMVDSLSVLVGQIQQASVQIASSSAEILAASKQAERGSAEQASSISQTTTTMDELLSASKQIAASADSVVQIAERTLDAALSGEGAVKEGIAGMNEIADNNRQTAERTLELSERNQEIGNVVDLIDEIADKSDLLALNAAIEGAKAGEAGRGFAVVATEMRALAENVVSSTKEIKGLISEIQKASNASVLATEGQMKATERGTFAAEKTAEHLRQITLMVEQTTEAAKQISLATQQQRTGTEQVVQSMSEIAKIAKSNVSGAEQTTASRVELAALADELKHAVTQFRLGGDDEDMAA